MKDTIGQLRGDEVDVQDLRDPPSGRPVALQAIDPVVDLSEKVNEAAVLGPREHQVRLQAPPVGGVEEGSVVGAETQLGQVALIAAKTRDLITLKPKDAAILIDPGGNPNTVDSRQNASLL